MRILNRPMFRYGGPIREGVMHGMRNNYQSGQLVRPGPGSPGYQGPPKTKVGMAGWLATKLPWWSKIKTGTKDIIPKTIKKIKGSQPLEDMRGVFTQTGTTPGITGSGAGQTFLQNLKSFSFPGATKALGWAKKAGQLALRKPKTTAVGSVYAAKPLYDLATGPGKKLVETAADVAVPDWLYNWETGRWFNPDDTDLKPSDKKILEEKKTEIITERGVPGGGDKSMTYTDPDAAKKLAQQKQNERLKSYLDMMGYDSAKKGALSDALIDASALVQDATTEAGSIKHADWGNLINRAIQTTSKRLDKPEQIREAVGLMATKAAIQKDLEDPQVKKLRALQIEDAEEKLNAGFEKDMSEFIFGSKTAPDKAQLKRYARLKADEHGLNFTIITDEVIDKIPKDATEKERMEQAGIVDDGIYMIGSEIIRVKDGKIKQIA